ncbi:MAG: DUF4124 domain-containing protein [Hahellaceae bacterium]|nr:DUF4124 domain-containing protein [Hahellaceae bacterium]MCP5168475.1 DUF4124 domain-containing protein [Hahellaceae bacterium]
MITKKTLLGLSFLLVGLAAPTFAQKMYKIVDAQGNVTFSQFPPATVTQQEQNLTIEKKDLSAEGETKVSTKGVYQYCGNIQLPNMLDNKSYFYSRIASQEASWEKQLGYKQKELDRLQKAYTQNHYYQKNQTASHLNRNNELGQQMRDLRCALNWAQSQKEQAAGQFEKSNAEVERLKSSLAKVESQMISQCGEEPIYEPSDPDNKNLRKKWKKCSKDYQKDITQLERLIRDESRKIK